MSKITMLTIQSAKSSISIDILKDKIYIEGEVEDIVELIITNFIKSKHDFQSFYLFDIVRSNNEIKMLTYSDQEEVIRISSCFKKYLKNIIFI